MGFSKLPSKKAFLITPNDDSNLPPVDGEGVTGVSVYVGRGGRLRYTDTSDNTQTVVVASGDLLDTLAKRVFSTDTSATEILGIYRAVTGGDFSETPWQELIVNQWNLITDTWN